MLFRRKISSFFKHISLTQTSCTWYIVVQSPTSSQVLHALSKKQLFDWKEVYCEDESRFCTIKDVYSSVTEVGTCGVSEADISGIKKGFVAKTIECSLMNCVQSVLSCGGFTCCTQIIVCRWLLILCVLVAGLRTLINLQKFRHLKLQVNLVGAKPYVKYCMLIRTIKIRFKVCEIWHLELGNILI